MSSTDLSGVAHAASRIQIEGPSASAGKIDLTEEDVTRVMPGELDERVGKNTVPPQRVESSDTFAGSGTPATARVVEAKPRPIGSVPEPEPDPDDDEEGGEDEDAIGTGLDDYDDIHDRTRTVVIDADKIERLREVASDSLFDAHVYDETPVVDGQATDTIAISLSGGVKLEATTDDARELFARLKLGKYVVARIEGVVAKKGGGYRENADGESSVTGSVTIKASEVRLLSPEELA